MPGLFTLTSFQSIAGMVFAAVIILAGLVALISKKQRVREVMFFTLSTALLAKVAIIECSRIVLYVMAQ